jgi:uncharacterized membrane protein YidH (DUF202 family)
MDAKYLLISVAIIAVGLLVAAPFMERRQSQRRNLDQPAWISWPLIQIIAILAFVISLVLLPRAW